MARVRRTLCFLCTALTPAGAYVSTEGAPVSAPPLRDGDDVDAHRPKVQTRDASSGSLLRGTSIAGGSKRERIRRWIYGSADATDLDELEARLLRFLQNASMPTLENEDKIPERLRPGVAAALGDNFVSTLLWQMVETNPMPAKFYQVSLVGKYILEYTTELPEEVRMELVSLDEGINDLAVMMSIDHAGNMEIKANLFSLDGHEQQVVFHKQMQQDARSPHFILAHDSDDEDERIAMNVRYMRNKVLVTTNGQEYDESIRRILEKAGVTSVTPTETPYVWRRIQSEDEAKESLHGRTSLWRFGLSQSAYGRRSSPKARVPARWPTTPASPVICRPDSKGDAELATDGELKDAVMWIFVMCCFSALAGGIWWRTAGWKRNGNTVHMSHNLAGVQMSIVAPSRGRSLIMRYVRAVEEVDPFSFLYNDREPQPGRYENAKFECDESVAFWFYFGQNGEGANVQDNLRQAAEVGAKYVTDGPEALAYWTKCAVRSSYFTANAALGTLAYALQAQRKRGADSRPSTNAAAASPTSTADSSFASDRGCAQADNSPEMATRKVLEASLTYEQDWKRIRDGVHKAPWDMELGNGQHSARKMIRDVRNLSAETVNKFSRHTSSGSTEPLSGGESVVTYPDYYRRDSYYQAETTVDETSTETLFVGRQDATQRGSLPPLREIASANGGAPRILEVACGTGRFATFIRDNHPRAKLTLVDLSLFCLEKARENDAYWRSVRGGVQEPATFVQAAAENLPFDDASFDAVVCLYLFHEMPEDARAEAAAEFARVCAPGGVVVLTDSIQRGDRPLLDIDYLHFDEPHYSNYMVTYLPTLFERHGLECATKSVASTSKTLSFRVPCSEYKMRRVTEEDWVLEKFRSTIVKHLQVDASVVKPESNFRKDLNVDSKAISALAHGVEKDFDIRFSDVEFAEGMTTVGSIVQRIKDTRSQMG